MSRDKPLAPPLAEPPSETKDEHQAVREHAKLDAGATDSAALGETAANLKQASPLGDTIDPEVKDLGFTAESSAVREQQLIRGLHNEELWKLIRRYNKQLFHLRAIPELPVGGLDMLANDDQEFTADKLRAEFERLYMTTLVSTAGFLKHIARLRSWRERNRTIAFLIGYVIAWYFDACLPALFTLLMLLVAFKPLRPLLFPPAPLALVSAKHGGLQKPKAGMLGSNDSLTGAAETHKGEAVEHEASQFITGVTSVAVSAAMGKGSPDSNESDDEDEKTRDSALPDPTATISGLADARGMADDSKPHAEVAVEAETDGDQMSQSAQADQTKVPVQTAIWAKTRPLMRGIAGISDTQEIFGNALSPCPPFSTMPRYRLAACFIPAILGSLVADAHLVSKGAFAGVGFVFFGQPVMDRAWHWLNTNIPDWPRYLEIQNTLLRGVPTNAQLAIALLRIGEAQKAPLPPPPKASAAPPTQPAHHEVAEVAKDNPLADEAEIHEAVTPDAELTDAEDADNKATPQKKSKVVGFLKATAAGMITMGGGKAQVEASTIGNEHAKNRLGALPRKGDKKFDGPSRFRARFHGHKGHAYITTSAVTPSIAFAKGYSSDDNKPIWTIQIEDIRELKKASGLGTISKLVVGAVLKRETADSLEIVDAEANTYRLTAIPRRDELFNRLSSLGSQKWTMM